eukprot:TRINITY_DN55456_c0_g1_i1.p1 TRINITY_DN55456_c0_g1~~TRINITY_DN55456_c0_g1_i1.p1  ORF type:complete len:480 (+),score=91.67 TRINITY_DN55456_c0_g1_i1:138-1442(+)
MPRAVHARQGSRLGKITRHVLETPPLQPLLASCSSSAPMKETASQAIDYWEAELSKLSHEIWSHPEVAYEEFHALRCLSDFVQKAAGTAVQEQYLGLPTSFRSEFGSGSPRVVICCEYDALPEIGHACGHNLIATVAVSTFLGLKKALESTSTPGTIILLGTPAEEAMGGKQELINRGALKDADCAMMAHPAPISGLYVPMLALSRAIITYTGRPAHASAAPWEGINALDAMLVAFHGISAARQQMKPTWRVHGVITKGGLKPNIIPDLTEAEFAFRAPDNSELAELKKMAQRCFEAAAMATGCEIELEWCSHDSRRLGHEYSTFKHNSTMNELYRFNAGSLGRSFRPKVVEEAQGLASTDMGNVSQVVPSIHPMFQINTAFPNHHPGFTKEAGSSAALKEALLTSKALAMTALDLICDSTSLAQVKDEFSQKD